MSQTVEPLDSGGSGGFELDPAVVRMYINNFGVAMGRSDIVLVARHNDSDVAAINMSYTTAKSLAQSLGELIAHLEAKTGNPIMTMGDIEQKLSEPPTDGSVES